MKLASIVFVFALGLLLMGHAEQGRPSPQSTDTAPQMSGDKLSRHLQDFKMEVIRQGLPPLAIPLTPEQDQQLVEAGVLPSMDEIPAKEGLAPSDPLPEPLKQYVEDFNARFNNTPVNESTLPPVPSRLLLEKKNMLADVNFREAPVEIILHLYAELTGLKVVTDEEVSARITCLPPRCTTYAETLVIIRMLLNDQGLAMTQVDETTVRIHKRE